MSKSIIVIEENETKLKKKKNTVVVEKHKHILGRPWSWIQNKFEVFNSWRKLLKELLCI